MTSRFDLQDKRLPSSTFDWSFPVEGDSARKNAFHHAARTQLKALANHLGWTNCSYDLRSNLAGIAVCGDTTLHHDHIYISVSQCRPGAGTGILIRSCKGLKDFVGGTNAYAPLELLGDVYALARRILPFIPHTHGGGAA